MVGHNQEIISISRTIYGTYLQTVKKLGIPYRMIENTTLNERFNVQAGIEPGPGKVPNMRYMAIGNLGHQTVKADDGSDETVPVIHRGTDACMYGPIPFVLRPLNDDLPAHRRAQYALRVMETHNGEQYIAYYLRRIDTDGVNAELQSITVQDDVITVTPYTPTSANLNPTPPDIDNSGVVIGSNQSETASAILVVRLTADDVAEIINAHRIRTGSSRSPVISEIALVSGVDKEVSGSSGGGTFLYNEVIAAQVNVFVSTYHAVGYATKGAEFTLDVGGADPMLGEDSLNQAEYL